MAADLPYTPVDREGHLDAVVEDGLAFDQAERAIIAVPPKLLQRRSGTQDPAADGTDHIPGQVEHSRLGRMEKAGHRLRRIEAVAPGEGERVEAIERDIGGRPDRTFEGGSNGLLDHLPQMVECRPDLYQWTAPPADRRMMLEPGSISSSHGRTGLNARAIDGRFLLAGKAPRREAHLITSERRRRGIAIVTARPNGTASSTGVPASRSR